MVRLKKRCVLVEIVADNDGHGDAGESSLLFDESDIIVALREAILATHGDFGLASIINSLYCKRFSPKTGCCLLLCRHGPHYLLITCLPFVKLVKNTPCTLRLVHLSGTIRGSLKQLKKLYEHQIEDIKSMTTKIQE